MRNLLTITALVLVLAASSASASLLGLYYNIDEGHPDMPAPAITGWDQGYVESMLAGGMPVLTPYGNSKINQFDWWSPGYEVFQRMDSAADLNGNFNGSWFPVDTGLGGDPHFFAVHWTGQFYVDSNRNYTYTMGSDDDSWLFVDGELVVDMGGVHGMQYDSQAVDLTQGFHDIDVFFAERHRVQSGFQLNYFSDEPPVPEPSTLMLLGTGLIGLVGLRKRFRK